MDAVRVSAVSVVMPTYNEGGHIERLIEATVTSLARSGLGTIEIIVVDDDSPDRTWELAQRTHPKGATVRVIRRMQNHGLTASIREGIAAATHDVVVWMDCDFSHPPEKIPQMIYMLGEGYDVAVNSRYTIGGGELRSAKGGPLQIALSFLLNWSIRFILNPRFSDYTSGFVACRKHVLQRVPLRGDYGEYFVDFIYRVLRRPFRVCELPYVAAPRATGESKTGSTLSQYLRRGRKYARAVARLRYESMLGRLSHDGYHLEQL